MSGAINKIKNFLGRGAFEIGLFWISVLGLLVCVIMLIYYSSTQGFSLEKHPALIVCAIIAATLVIRGAYKGAWSPMSYALKNGGYADYITTGGCDTCGGEATGGCKCGAGAVGGCGCGGAAGGCPACISGGCGCGGETKQPDGVVVTGSGLLDIKRNITSVIEKYQGVKDNIAQAEKTIGAVCASLPPEKQAECKALADTINSINQGLQPISDFVSQLQKL